MYILPIHTGYSLAIVILLLLFIYLLLLFLILIHIFFKLHCWLGAVYLLYSEHVTNTILFGFEVVLNGL